MTDETTTLPDTTTSPTDAPATDASAPADTSVLGDAVETAADAPASDAPTEVQGAPEKYELTLEGLTLDAVSVAEAEPVLRELNLTNEQANKLLPVASGMVQRAAQQGAEAEKAKNQEEFLVLKNSWYEQFKADPEIGGAKEAESTHLAAKALDALGFKLTGHGEDGKQPHPFRTMLTEFGFGNYPDMIRAFRKVGEMIGEDGFVRPGTADTREAPMWERMYPNEK